MIRQVHRSADVAGVLRRLYRPAGGSDVRLIASWDWWPEQLAATIAAGAGEPRTGELARLLAQPVRVCERAPEQYVYHLVLRNAPTDRTLSDAEWAEIAADMMTETGIAPADDWSACRWVAIRAEDAAVHVVATLAREDGREPHLFKDFVAIAGVAHRYEQRHGLASTDPRQPA